MSGFVECGRSGAHRAKPVQGICRLGQPQQGTPGTNGLGIIKQGFLESSNVNVVEELVNMIQTQRAYEMNSKAISTTDQMLAKLCAALKPAPPEESLP